ncbi:Cytosine deaminase [Shimia sp. SK013]|nr:Cytosine deaminase [Shimia sp. SK013]
MNLRMLTDQILKDVLVPVSMLAHPDRFGGHKHQDCLHGDLVVRDGKALGLQNHDGHGDARQLVMPKLTECHVHLDKCHSISRMHGVGGDLQAAIEAQALDRAIWTTDDVRDRATRGLQELIGSGCRSVRSHVDWTHGADATVPPLAWHVLNELEQDHRNRVTLQICPLTGIDDLADSDVANSIARLVAATTGVLGAFVFQQPNRQEGIKNAFRVAEKFGLALDFHVDEGLADGLNGLELVADAALEHGFQGPVLCGHACSLANLQGPDLTRVTDKIARAGLTIAALPATNLYLQGRASGTPDRRGITRMRELGAAGVPVVVGTDNVRDAFCPIGRHDPCQSLALAVLTAHLDPPFGDYLPMITTGADRALGLAPAYVDVAAIGDLLLFDATSTSDILSGTTRPVPLSDVCKGETV